MQCSTALTKLLIIMLNNNTSQFTKISINKLINSNTKCCNFTVFVFKFAFSLLLGRNFYHIAKFEFCDYIVPII